MKLKQWNDVKNDVKKLPIYSILAAGACYYCIVQLRLAVFYFSLGHRPLLRSLDIYIFIWDIKKKGISGCSVYILN